jgi:ribose/xylose/arabinose/galactoside ABC-type transport system permease subunit
MSVHGDAPSRPGRWARLAGLKPNEWGLVAAILIVALLTSVLDSNHNYWNDPWLSLKDIVRQTSLLGIFSLGAAVVIIAGGIDLSAGSMIAFSGTICGTLLVLLDPQAMQGAQPIGLGAIAAAILGTLAVGFLVGSLHAWLITAIGLPPFIATLSSLVGLRSLSRVLCSSVTKGNTQINIFDDRFRYLATSVWIPAALFLLLAFAVWVLLNRTVVGRHIYALGGNEQAARLSGIRTEGVKWLAYVIGSLTASIAGVLFICDQSVADPQTLGRGQELNAIAAAVVGGVSLQGGVGTVPGTILGAVFLRIVVDGISKIIKTGADVYEGLIVGFVVVVAVAFSKLRDAGSRREFFPGALGIAALATLVALVGLLAGLMSTRAAGAAAAAVALAALGVVKVLELRRQRSPR